MTYADFVRWKRGDMDDQFAIRVLSKCTRDATISEDPVAFHADPGTTGHDGWDRAVRGTAALTARICGIEAPAWTSPQGTGPLFDPGGTLARWLFVAYIETPIELRRHGVILPRSSLMTLGGRSLEPTAVEVWSMSAFLGGRLVESGW
ncbi:hypothetical protein [Corynebacterium terpenotabidum]|uniref:Uncharacterized protein n=1 Tax=Corynebacterium terpenotabidum Y-11 TaxID=1200352 RepID=S4XCA8_9CORY|nr:hypothetical protein [Corynebacterium terpenotabidum]AGP30124.1 hypothetical protein A606_02355 [Corynebacterium terpenotabidum Y-11]